MAHVQTPIRLIHDKVTAKAYEHYARLAARKNTRSHFYRAKRYGLYFESSDYVTPDKQQDVLMNYEHLGNKEQKIVLEEYKSGKNFEQSDRWDMRLIG